MARLFKLLNEEMVNTLVLRLMSNLSMENKINISYIMKYMFKIFRLLLLGIGITYIIACLWYIFIYNMEEDHKPSFYKLINVPENSNFRKYKKLIFIYFFRFVICCYFILTTLATVGYGDYVP